MVIEVREWLAASSREGPGVCSCHWTASALGCKSKELNSATFCKEDVKDKIADIQWDIVSAAKQMCKVFYKQIWNVLGKKLYYVHHNYIKYGTKFFSTVF
jgi:hypothetical protein